MTTAQKVDAANARGQQVATTRTAGQTADMESYVNNSLYNIYTEQNREKTLTDNATIAFAKSNKALEEANRNLSTAGTTDDEVTSNLKTATEAVTNKENSTLENNVWYQNVKARVADYEEKKAKGETNIFDDLQILGIKKGIANVEKANHNIVVKTTDEGKAYTQAEEAYALNNQEKEKGLKNVNTYRTNIEATEQELTAAQTAYEEAAKAIDNCTTEEEYLAALQNVVDKASAFKAVAQNYKSMADDLNNYYSQLVYNGWNEDFAEVYEGKNSIEKFLLRTQKIAESSIQEVLGGNGEYLYNLVEFKTAIRDAKYKLTDDEQNLYDMFGDKKLTEAEFNEYNEQNNNKMQGNIFKRNGVDDYEEYLEYYDTVTKKLKMLNKYEKDKATADKVVGQKLLDYRKQGQEALQLGSYGMNEWVAVVYQLVPSLAGMTVDGAMNLLAPGSSLMSMGSRVFGNAMADARNDGVDDGQAFAYAAVSTAVELGTEMMFGIGAKGAIYGEGIASEPIYRAIAKIDSAGLRRAAILATTVTGEGLEEVVAEYFQPLCDALREYNDETHFIDAYIKNRSGQTVDEYIKAFMGGALASFLGIKAIEVASNVSGGRIISPLTMKSTELRAKYLANERADLGKYGQALEIIKDQGLEKRYRTLYEKYGDQLKDVQAGDVLIDKNNKAVAVVVDVDAENGITIRYKNDSEDTVLPYGMLDGSNGQSNYMSKHNGHWGIADYLAKGGKFVHADGTAVGNSEAEQEQNADDHETTPPVAKNPSSTVKPNNNGTPAGPSAPSAPAGPTAKSGKGGRESVDDLFDRVTGEEGEASLEKGHTSTAPAKASFNNNDVTDINTTTLKAIADGRIIVDGVTAEQAKTELERRNSSTPNEGQSAILEASQEGGNTNGTQGSTTTTAGGSGQQANTGAEGENEQNSASDSEGNERGRNQSGSTVQTTETESNARESTRKVNGSNVVTRTTIDEDGTEHTTETVKLGRGYELTGEDGAVVLSDEDTNKPIVRLCSILKKIGLINKYSIFSKGSITFSFNGEVKGIFGGLHSRINGRTALSSINDIRPARHEATHTISDNYLDLVGMEEAAHHLDSILNDAFKNDKNGSRDLIFDIIDITYEESIKEKANKYIKKYKLTGEEAERVRLATRLFVVSDEMIANINGECELYGIDFSKYTADLRSSPLFAQLFDELQKSKGISDEDMNELKSAFGMKTAPVNNLIGENKKSTKQKSIPKGSKKITSADGDVTTFLILDREEDGHKVFTASSAMNWNGFSKIVKSGVTPAPSIAVTSIKNNTINEGFGNIFAFFRKRVIDPEESDDNRIYSAIDAKQDMIFLIPEYYKDDAIYKDAIDKGFTIETYDYSPDYAARHLIDTFGLTEEYGDAESFTFMLYGYPDTTKKEKVSESNKLTDEQWSKIHRAENTGVFVDVTDPETGEVMRDKDGHYIFSEDSLTDGELKSAFWDLVKKTGIEKAGNKRDYNIFSDVAAAMTGMYLDELDQDNHGENPMIHPEYDQKLLDKLMSCINAMTMRGIDVNEYFKGTFKTYESDVTNPFFAADVDDEEVDKDVLAERVETFREYGYDPDNQEDVARFLSELNRAYDGESNNALFEDLTPREIDEIRRKAFPEEYVGDTDKKGKSPFSIVSDQEQTWDYRNKHKYAASNNTAVTLASTNTDKNSNMYDSNGRNVPDAAALVSATLQEDPFGEDYRKTVAKYQGEIAGFKKQIEEYMSQYRKRSSEFEETMLERKIEKAQHEIDKRNKDIEQLRARYEKNRDNPISPDYINGKIRRINKYIIDSDGNKRINPDYFHSINYFEESHNRETYTNPTSERLDSKGRPYYGLPTEYKSGKNKGYSKYALVIDEKTGKQRTERVKDTDIRKPTVQEREHARQVIEDARNKYYALNDALLNTFRTLADLQRARDSAQKAAHIMRMVPQLIEMKGMYVSNPLHEWDNGRIDKKITEAVRILDSLNQDVINDVSQRSQYIYNMQSKADELTLRMRSVYKDVQELLAKTIEAKRDLNSGEASHKQTRIWANYHLVSDDYTLKEIIDALQNRTFQNSNSEREKASRDYLLDLLVKKVSLLRGGYSAGSHGNIVDVNGKLTSRATPSSLANNQEGVGKFEAEPVKTNNLINDDDVVIPTSYKDAYSVYNELVELERSLDETRDADIIAKLKEHTKLLQQNKDNYDEDASFSMILISPEEHQAHENAVKSAQEYYTNLGHSTEYAEKAAKEFADDTVPQAIMNGITAFSPFSANENAKDYFDMLGKSLKDLGYDITNVEYQAASDSYIATVKQHVEAGETINPNGPITAEEQAEFEQARTQIEDEKVAQNPYHEGELSQNFDEQAPIDIIAGKPDSGNTNNPEAGTSAAKDTQESLYNATFDSVDKQEMEDVTNEAGKLTTDEEVEETDKNGKKTKKTIIHGTDAEKTFTKNLHDLATGHMNLKAFYDYYRGLRTDSEMSIYHEQALENALEEAMNAEKAMYAGAGARDAVLRYRSSLINATKRLSTRFQRNFDANRDKADAVKTTKSKNAIKNFGGWARSWIGNAGTIFKAITGFCRDENSVGYKMAKKVENSVMDAQTMIARANRMLYEFGKEKSSSDFINGKLDSGVTLLREKGTMEAQQALGLYATLRTLQNKNVDISKIRHIWLRDAQGDYECVEVNIPKKDAKGFPIKGEIEDGDLTKFYGSMSEIMHSESATEAGKVMASAYDSWAKVARYFAPQLGDTYRAINGVELGEVTDDDYFPIHYKSRDDVDVQWDFDMQKNLNSMSIVNDRVEGKAFIPVIPTFMAAANSYINQATNYTAFAELSDQLKLMDKSTEGNLGLSSRMGNALGARYAEWYKNYIKTLDNDHGPEKEGFQKVLQSARGITQKGILIGNPTVPVKQVSSYWSAMSVLSPTSLMLARSTRLGSMVQVLNKSAKYRSDIIDYRMQGGIDPTLAEIMKSSTNPNRIQRLIDNSPLVKLANNAIPFMDVTTVNNLYTATVYDVAAANPDVNTSSAKFAEMVEQKFAEVVFKTQPIFNPQARAEYARSDNEYIRLTSMFQTQQNQNLNNLMVSIGEYMNGIKNKNLSDAEKSKLNHTIKGQLVASISFAILTMLSDALLHKWKKYRPDDDDETLAGNIAERLMLNFAENLASVVPFGDSVAKASIDAIASAVNEDTDINEFYGVSLGVISNIYTMIKDFEYYKETPSRYRIARLIKDASTIGGAWALNNGYTIANAIAMWVIDLNGDNPGGYDDYLRWAHLDTTSELNLTGDELQYAEDYKNAHHLNLSDIDDDYDKGLVDDDVYRDYLEFQHRNDSPFLQETTHDKIEESMNIAKFRKDTGINYNKLSELYLSNEDDHISADQVIEARMSVAGDTYEEAQQYVYKQDFKKEYGVNYEQMAELYKYNGITAEDAIKWRTKCGSSQTSAEHWVKAEDLHIKSGVEYDGKYTDNSWDSYSTKDKMGIISFYDNYGAEFSSDKVFGEVFNALNNSIDTYENKPDIKHPNFSKYGYLSDNQKSKIYCLRDLISNGKITKDIAKAIWTDHLGYSDYYFNTYMNG